MPICKSVDQKTMVHYAMEYYIVETRKELLPFAIAWMELENIMLSEVSQVVRDKCHMISPITAT